MLLLYLSAPSLHAEVVVGGVSISVSGGQGSQQVLGVCFSSLSQWIHGEGPELLGGAAGPDGKHKSITLSASKHTLD